MGAPTEPTAEQMEAVTALGEALAAMARAGQLLEAAGLDWAQALRLIPAGDEGGSMYDELPLQIRMLVG